MIKFTQKGDFSKLDKYFERLREVVKMGSLDRYGRAGVQALESVTPIDSGETAKSWEYSIRRSANKITISFHNTNIQNGVPIAILLQYGHATRTGGYVQGIDYINPAIRPIFNQIARDAWGEVTKL